MYYFVCILIGLVIGAPLGALLWEVYEKQIIAILNRLTRNWRDLE